MPCRWYTATQRQLKQRLFNVGRGPMIRLFSKYHFSAMPFPGTTREPLSTCHPEHGRAAAHCLWHQTYLALVSDQVLLILQSQTGGRWGSGGGFQTSRGMVRQARDSRAGWATVAEEKTESGRGTRCQPLACQAWQRPFSLSGLWWHMHSFLMRKDVQEVRITLNSRSQ